MEFKHVSIMLNQCINGLDIKKDGIYIDGTMGGAGHSYHIVEKLRSGGKLIGIDQDTDAIEASRMRLKEFNNVTFVNDNFVNIKAILESLGIEAVDGILLDLGVSSYQLDTDERGFSYMKDAPLDMRMNRNSDKTARDIVNLYSKDELKNVIKSYGEEKWAAKIAEFIVNAREVKPIETTYELVDIIKSAIPAAARRDGPHPAKRTFQAIRIEVNMEIEILNAAINDCIDVLKPGGRICVITFHSLEDRIVKNVYKTRENPCDCPASFPICICGKKPEVRIITRKPIIPDANEIEENPRSRSAKLRIAEKL